jgi:hypothetical protein
VIEPAVDPEQSTEQVRISSVAASVRAERTTDQDAAQKMMLQDLGKMEGQLETSLKDRAELQALLANSQGQGPPPQVGVLQNQLAGAQITESGLEARLAHVEMALIWMVSILVLIFCYSWCFVRSASCKVTSPCSVPHDPDEDEEELTGACCFDRCSPSRCGLQRGTPAAPSGAGAVLHRPMDPELKEKLQNRLRVTEGSAAKGHSRAAEGAQVERIDRQNRHRSSPVPPLSGIPQRPVEKIKSTRDEPVRCEYFVLGSDSENEEDCTPRKSIREESAPDPWTMMETPSPTIPEEAEEEEDELEPSEASESSSEFYGRPGIVPSSSSTAPSTTRDSGAEEASMATSACAAPPQ